MTEALLARVPQACEMLNCSRPTLYNLLRDGTLKNFKDGGVRKIEIASIRAYIAQKIANDQWCGSGRGTSVDGGK